MPILPAFFRCTERLPGRLRCWQLDGRRGTFAEGGQGSAYHIVTFFLNSALTGDEAGKSVSFSGIRQSDRAAEAGCKQGWPRYHDEGDFMGLDNGPQPVLQNTRLSRSAAAIQGMHLWRRRRCFCNVAKQETS